MCAGNQLSEGTCRTEGLRNMASISFPALVRGRVAALAFFVILGASTGTWAARIPAIQARLELTPAQLSLALLASAVGLIASAMFTGAVIGRVGSQRVVRIAAPLVAATLPPLALAPNLALLVVALFFYGAMGAVLDISMNSQAVAVERGYGHPILSSFHAFFSVGGFLGALLGGLIAGRGIAPFPHFLGVALVLIVVALLAGRWVIRDEPAPDPAPDEYQPLIALPSRRLLGLCAIAFIVLVTEGAMGDWSALYLHQTLLAAPALAAAGFATFSVAMAVARLGGDYVTARLGTTSVIAGGSSLAALGLALALLAPVPLLAIAGFGLVGLGCATIFPLVISSAGKLGGVTGRAVAALTTFGYLGYLLGPPMIGGVATLLSLRGGLALVVVLLLGSVGLARTAAGGVPTPDVAREYKSVAP